MRIVKNKKLIVIGGGAAGFFCAINAAELAPQLEVLILEKTGKVLSKVKVSGGGRCNVTHACFSISEMIKRYPRGSRFLKQAFHHFFTNDTISWFENRGVPLKTEADGRMFPKSNTSESIIQCMLKEMGNKNIELQMNREVVEIDTSGHNGIPFRIHLKEGNSLTCDFLCIACGGYPKFLQYQWLEKSGHSFSAPVPSLFTFNIPAHPISSLMGISVQEAVVKINGTKLIQDGPLLITHWGFSGPAILKLSAFAALELAQLNYDFSITINWLGKEHENSLLDKIRTIRNEQGARKIGVSNPFEIPQRLWNYFLDLCGINPGIRWADLPSKQQNMMAKEICSSQFRVKGKTTFKEEFVTAGGIELSEINASTMESKIIPGLFFAGEILNIDGITGGYNFQNAWTTGWIAAKAVAEKCTL